MTEDVNTLMQGMHYQLNRRWARNVVNKNPAPSGNFLRLCGMAFLAADEENEQILNMTIRKLRIKYPKYDIEEKEF